MDFNLKHKLYVPKKAVRNLDRSKFTYSLRGKITLPDGSVIDGPIEHTAYKELSNYYVFERGNLLKIKSIFGHKGTIIDETCFPQPKIMKYVRMRKAIKGKPIKLRDDQLQAFDDVINSVVDGFSGVSGIVCASPGFGKTILAIALLIHYKTRVLFMCDQGDLLIQFLDKLRLFTNVTAIEEKLGRPIVGKIKKGKPLPLIATSTYQYMAHKNNKGYAQSIRDKFGLVILDEVHSAGATSFSKVSGFFNSRHRIGLSATPTRKDGKHVLIYDIVGPIIHEVEVKRSTHVRIVFTGCSYRKNLMYSKLLTLMSKDPSRNKLICAEVAKEVRQGHKILILTDRKMQAIELKTYLASTYGITLELFMGGYDGENQMKKISAGLKRDSSVESGAIDGIVATTKKAVKGLDFPELSSLHYVAPMANYENLKQAIGRIERPCENKLSPIATYWADSKNNNGIIVGCCNTVISIVKRLQLPLAFDETYAVSYATENQKRATKEERDIKELFS